MTGRDVGTIITDVEPQEWRSSPRLREKMI